MASPFKTQETMDLARALLEEDSLPSVSKGRRGHEESEESLDTAAFRSLVVTKDSSTDLIPTQLVESSDATVINENKPGRMLEMVRGKGLDDDGKPVVGKVFSRVIQINSNENKPKQLKARRGSTKKDEFCPGAGCASNREKNNHERPQSSAPKPEREQLRTSGPASISNVCPACKRQFSDEALRHHMVFCNPSSKEIM